MLTPTASSCFVCAGGVRFLSMNQLNQEVPCANPLGTQRTAGKKRKTEVREEMDCNASAVGMVRLRTQKPNAVGEK